MVAVRQLGSARMWKKLASRRLSALGGLGGILGAALDRYALRLEASNPDASFRELNRQTGGHWGLKNAAFEKDPELLNFFMRFGTHQGAQILQDLAYLKFFSPKNNGYFVEVGVGDGLHLSNTILFEREFGWNGLLIEPNPKFHDAIRLNRQARLETRAASNANCNLALFLSDGELSRLQDTVYHDSHHRAGQSVPVRTATLTEILGASGAPDRIDYMSIDTEGNELDVLEGLDFNLYKFDFITVEHNYVSEKRENIRYFLENLGYLCVSNAASFWDDWYVRAFEIENRVNDFREF